eukprot:TRINITY_DN5478_c0_g1_i1.p1 TRINITY_DN5478_c0_g1~~TRINITY_DN5478_c0_g1_i1.p1  ORF type:complete len:483 (+),score=106.57 TRINITY_DN5478_c0_g1_i1:363-1811(+)
MTGDQICDSDGICRVISSSSSSSSEEDVGGNNGQETVNERLKVAVIGSGIAGSSSAYYISKLMPQADITLFEKNEHSCGRVTDTIIHGKNVEVGGSIYHESNANVDGFVKQFNLTRQHAFGGGPMAIWDGEEVVFLSSQMPYVGKYVNLASMVYRYGFSPLRLKSYLDNLIKNWTALYDDTEPFNSVEEFFERIHLEHTLQEPAVPHLRDVVGLSELFIKEMIGAMTRVNYNTDVNDISLWGAAISAMGSLGEVYSIVGGNRQLCSHLLQASGARLHFGTAIKKIRQSSKSAAHDDLKYEVEWDGGKETYDVVIIATPLELASIEFPGIELDPFIFDARHYRPVHVTFLGGELNGKYFEIETADDVLTAESEKIPFSSIGLIENVHTDDGHKVYKIFSRQKLSETLMDELILNHTVAHKRIIHAYPILRPTDKFVPTTLAPHLYYVNAFETAVSTIETETIAAKNVARLAAKSLGYPYHLTL